MVDPVQTAFSHLMGVDAYTDDLTPYPYQLTVAETLLSGRRVVLRAPQASGKTLAAWLPWVANRLQPGDFPLQLLHALPGGIFTEDLYRRLAALERQLPEMTARIQTEAEAYDPFFLGDAIITSTEQLLSVALHRTLGLHPGLCNTNAGALLSAYLVVDDFPALLSRDRLAIWLGLLRRYYPETPCLWMTSICPRPVARHIAALLNAEYLEADGEVPGGARQWYAQPHRSADDILRAHRSRTIVVCNTVRGAQRLYRSLRPLVAQLRRPPELLLLHQYQFGRDRVPVAHRAAELFTSTANANALLVTTSGIKIGADLSAELLISDPVSADRLLQRAGRCARGVGERGRVVVAPVTDFHANDQYPAPAAGALLAALGRAPVTAADELAALDTVFAAANAEEPSTVVTNPLTAEECDAAAEREVRGWENDRIFTRVGVALHRIPETVQDPFELERFSLALSSLERGWRQWQASGGAGEWFALIPQWPAPAQRAPRWAVMTDPGEIDANTHIVILNAEAVSYDPVIGLELAPGTAYQSACLPEQHTTWAPFDQHVELYTEHVARVADAFERHLPAYRYALRHLARHWQMPMVELERWMRLCILWHDAGKLTQDWQRAAYRWQEEVVRRPVTQGLLGRIDFQHKRDHTFPCPIHAPTTARVLSRALGVVLANHPALHAGSLQALSHHHGVIPSLLMDTTPHVDAWPLLMSLAATVLDPYVLPRLDRAGWMPHTARSQPEINPTPPGDPDAWMAYSLLVRAIRLADRELVLSAMLA